MRIAVLTSIETRHRYFANAIRRRLPVVAIGYEHIGYAQSQISADGLSAEEARIVREHFQERARQEELFFGQDAEPIACRPLEHASLPEPCAARSGDWISRTIAAGQLNTSATLDYLLAREVDTVVVFGTNLIKSPLLERWQGRMINMHLGLSPYYRGTATNFYPLLNLEPQFVGATIHLIDAGIDSGPVLCHARPRLSPDDRPHVIGCKAILAGIDAMIAVLKRLERDGRLAGTPQWAPENGRLYLRRDYHQHQVVELYRKIGAGLLRAAIQRANQLEEPRLVTLASLDGADRG